MIIQLNENHLKECLDIACLKNRVSGTSPISRESLEKKIKKSFLNEDLNYAFGVLENNEITSWMSISFHENRKRGRFWVITGFYIKSFKDYFKFNKTEYEVLVRHCISFAESLNYTQFYYSVSKRISSSFTKQWSKSNLSKMENYITYDIAVVPAFTQPESELYWRLMGEEIKPDDIIIKHRVRKM